MPIEFFRSASLSSHRSTNTNAVSRYRYFAFCSASILWHHTYLPRQGYTLTRGVFRDFFPSLPPASCGRLIMNPGGDWRPCEGGISAFPFNFNVSLELRCVGDITQRMRRGLQDIIIKIYSGLGLASNFRGTSQESSSVLKTDDRLLEDSPGFGPCVFWCFDRAWWNKKNFGNAEPGEGHFLHEKSKGSDYIHDKLSLAR